MGFGNADFTDILTPEVVAEGDFVYKPHLTTVLVVVPKDATADFLATYESADGFVVPRSAKQFMKVDEKDDKLKVMEDKDGIEIL